MKVSRCEAKTPPSFRFHGLELQLIWNRLEWKGMQESYVSHKRVWNFLEKHN